MFLKHTRKRVGITLIAGFLMCLDFILHPPGARIENVQDETCRKKDAQSGEPFEEGGEHDSLVDKGA